MRMLSLPRQEQQLTQTHFLCTGKQRQVGQYMLPHEPVPGHDPCSPESCTSLELMDMKQMYAVRWEKNALDSLLPSAIAVCWSEPCECWQRCAGLLGWDALKAGYRITCVSVWASVGYEDTPFRKTKQKSTLVYFYGLFLGAYPQTVLERSENKNCYV